MRSLEPVITVDEEKCVNCHKCIAVCPVKYCNNGSEDHVNINTDMCIACGQCLTACTHEARNYLDDFYLFLQDLNDHTPMVAVVAPSVAANFPNHYLRFNGWLKSIGIDAIFDVSFGAELTVQTYLDHIKTNKPELVIAQPCPAIVTYIELYIPDLIPYLAPADSPMMHTMKMIKNYYPRYKQHKIVIISPCIAKKREFSEVGIGDYNVTMDRVYEYMKTKTIDLNDYAEIEFDNDPAERAVLFSTPGGLMRTAERYHSDIASITRKIEGPDVVYEYLEHLPAQLGKGYNPKLVDILNCHKGCNGGTGTPHKNVSQDELEHYIEKRRVEMQKRYKTIKKGKSNVNRLHKTISRFWKQGLYGRDYVDRSENNIKRLPSEQQIDEIYQSLAKTTEDDIKNCASCGYDSCEGMAIAIHNNLNRRENCHFYLEKTTYINMDEKERMITNIGLEIERITGAISTIDSNTANLVTLINKQLELVQQTSDAVASETDQIKDLVSKMEERATDKLVSLTQTGGLRIESLTVIMHEISSISEQMKEIVNTIDDISNKTNILSINASIQSAHAGEYGKPFSVVAREIKSLAGTTANHVDEISKFIKSTNLKLKEANLLSQQGGQSFSEIAHEVDYVDRYLQEVGTNMNIMSSNSRSVYYAQNELAKISQKVLLQSQDVSHSIRSISESLDHLRKLS